jgi:hypothetical protein
MECVSIIKFLISINVTGAIIALNNAIEENFFDNPEIFFFKILKIELKIAFIFYNNQTLLIPLLILPKRQVILRLQHGSQLKKAVKQKSAHLK